MDKTPKIHNVSARRSTRSDKRNGAESMNTNTSDGVAVDGLTASLLGLPVFIPFADDDDKRKDGGSSVHVDDEPFEGAHTAISASSPKVIDYDDNSTLTDDEMRTSSRDGGAKTIIKSTRSSKKRKKLKGALKSIKKSVVRKSSSSVANKLGGVGQNRVLEREFDNKAVGFSSVAVVNGTSSDLLELKITAAEARERASALTGRVESLCSEISDLEQRLHAARKALAGDMAQLDVLTAQMNNMEAQKREVEGQVASVESLIQVGGEKIQSTGVPEHGPLAPLSSKLTPQCEPTVKKMSSFIRIHDLDLAQDIPSTNGVSKGRGAQGKPPKRGSSLSLSIPMHEVDSGSERPGLANVGSKIAPAIVEALARMAYDAASDESESRWTPSADTKKLLSKRNDINSPGEWINVPANDVYVWHSKFDHHGGFGSDLPVVKARGIISCSARSLVSLLLDSSRSKEYNKMSIGRSDEFWFNRNSLSGVTTSADAVDYDSVWSDLVGETRILRSLSQPPMVRKPIEILTLYHARELDIAAEQVDGFLIVSRSLWEREDMIPADGGGAGGSDGSTSRTEMLLGAQLIRVIDDSTCELTTINHLFSKSIPLMLAKKIGLMTAASFIRDIQLVFDK